MFLFEIQKDMIDARREIINNPVQPDTLQKLSEAWHYKVFDLSIIE